MTPRHSYLTFTESSVLNSSSGKSEICLHFLSGSGLPGGLSHCGLKRDDHQGHQGQEGAGRWLETGGGASCCWAVGPGQHGEWPIRGLYFDQIEKCILTVERLGGQSEGGP